MATTPRAGRRGELKNSHSAEESSPHRSSVGLCLKCLEHMELSNCQLVHLSDGGTPLAGHLRDGGLCAPVFDEAHLGDDVNGLGVLEFEQPDPD